MLIKEKVIELKNKKECILRSPREDDAALLIDLLKCVCDETPFLVSEPDEIKYTIEGENAKRGTDNDWVRIDRMHLSRHMGLAESRGNCDNLSVVIKALRKLGYIKVKQENIVEVDEEGNKKPKTVNYYKLTTYQEWYELTNKK